jgi:hypothetical protein
MINVIILVIFIAFPGIVYGEWKTYFLPEGNISILLPEQPTKKVTHFKKAKGIVVPNYTYQSCQNNCEIAYTVTYGDWGKNSNIAKNPEAAMDHSKNIMLKNVNGTLTFEKNIKYRGYPGREQKINIDTHQGLYIGLQRIYIVNGKMYVINVSTPAKYQFMPEHYKFLDSFTIK